MAKSKCKECKKELKDGFLNSTVGKFCNSKCESDFIMYVLSWG